MTVKEFKAIVNSISPREDNRDVSFCGNLMRTHGETLDSIEVSWIDCSDGILVVLNESKKW